MAPKVGTSPSERRERAAGISKRSRGNKRNQFNTQVSADGKIHLPAFKPGDFVIQQERKLGSTELGTSTKLLNQWSGPHCVVRQVRGKTDIYEIKMGNTGRITKRAADLLRPIDPRPMLLENMISTL